MIVKRVLWSSISTRFTLAPPRTTVSVNGGNNPRRFPQEAFPFAPANVSRYTSGVWYANHLHSFRFQLRRHFTDDVEMECITMKALQWDYEVR